MEFDEPTALYIHVPFCTTKCGYCAFYSEPIDKYDAKDVVSGLISEIKQYELGREIQTVYIGGGSPSCLPPDQLMRLIDEIITACSEPAEFTVEVNPSQVTEDMLQMLQSAAVNRLSIGAQSFNDRELQFLGRDHTAGDAKKIVTMAKQAGFYNISIDLIFAIPGSTIYSWTENLQAAIDLGVQHISAYSLTYEKGTLLHKLLHLEEIEPVDDVTDRDMYELAIERLTREGFRHYEISNFAKNEFESRHNLTYWANKSYIGIGPSASSYLQGERTSNIANIRKYIASITEKLSVVAQSESPNEIETACQTAILNLRRINGIDLAQFEEQTGFDAMQIFAEQIEKYKRVGLLATKAGRVFLTKKALPIADSILSDFTIV